MYHRARAQRVETGTETRERGELWRVCFKPEIGSYEGCGRSQKHGTGFVYKDFPAKPSLKLAISPPLEWTTSYS